MTSHLYRDRLSRKAPLPDLTDEQVSLQRLYHNVFGSPEGLKVLDDICERLCHIDTAATGGDPYAIVEFNGRRSVGIEIARLALAPFDDRKPEVVR